MLALWQRYRSLYSQCVAAVQKQEERADRLLRSATDREITEEESVAWINDCSVSRDQTMKHSCATFDHVNIIKAFNIFLSSSLPKIKTGVGLLLHLHSQEIVFPFQRKRS